MIVRGDQVMEAIAVVVIVCVAAGYLILRYVKKARAGVECGCENKECPLRGSGPEAKKNFRHEMNCETKECKKGSL